MKKVIQYDHHGNKVWVMESNKGKHRKYCLCFQCKHLNTENKDKNCQVARILYEMCRAFELTMPVWECPTYEPKEEK